MMTMASEDDVSPSLLTEMYSGSLPRKPESSLQGPNRVQDKRVYLTQQEASVAFNR